MWILHKHIVHSNTVIYFYINNLDRPWSLRRCLCIFVLAWYSTELTFILFRTYRFTSLTCWCIVLVLGMTQAHPGSNFSNYFRDLSDKYSLFIVGCYVFSFITVENDGNNWIHGIYSGIKRHCVYSFFT